MGDPKTLDLDPGPGTDDHTSNGGVDSYISKFDLDGIYSWGMSWGGSSSDYVYGVAADSDGNVYCTGGFMGTADFDPGSGVDQHTSNGDADAYLTKYNDAGQHQWALTWGGTTTDQDEGFAVAIDAFGYICVAGHFKGTVDFDPDIGQDIYTSAGDYDAFLSKFDSSGDHLWTRTFGGSGAEMVIDVARDGLGNVLLPGAFTDGFDFDPGPGVDIHEHTQGYASTFIMKLLPNGYWN